MKGLLLSFHVILFVILISSLATCIGEDYFNQLCNTSVYVDSSRRLESSTSLFYKPNVACSYTVTVDSNKNVMLLQRRFDLENEVKNACVDFVNIHDGGSTSDSTLNASPLCGELSPANYTSSGNKLTVWFQTDARGSKHGFDFIFVAVTTAPCGSSQFACNNSICVDSSLRCSVYNECGDNSDEKNCQYATLKGVEISEDAPVIIGLTIGLFIACIILLIIGLWCWKQNRWRLFAKRPITAKEVILDETTFTTAYPVTKVYYKAKYQDMYREPVKPSLDYGSSIVSFSEQASTSTRKQSMDDI